MKTILFVILNSIFSTLINAQVSDTLYLFYELNADYLNSAEQQKLDNFIEQQKDHIKSVHINTFCDTSATVEYNESLSSRRLINLRLAFNSIPISSFNAFGEEIKDMTNYDATFARRAEVIYTFVQEESKESTDIEIFPQEIGEAFAEFIADTATTETTIRLSIQFYPNKDVHCAEFEGELKQLHRFMSDNLNVNAHIRGHVCCGDDYKLSSKRAFKVYKYLTGNSIDTSRLSFKGYSNRNPVVYPEVTEYDKLQNRRVDIIFTK